MIVKLAAGAKKIRFDNTAYQNKPTRIAKSKCDHIDIQWLSFHEVNESSLTRLKSERAFYVKTQTTK